MSTNVYLKDDVKTEHFKKFMLNEIRYVVQHASTDYNAFGSNFKLRIASVQQLAKTIVIKCHGKSFNC